jgi:hypothetical protein
MQFYGKMDKIMVKVPKEVKKETQEAFMLRSLGFKGGLETGWKRATQLTTKAAIPIQDLRFMRNWYARHVYTSYPGYKKWKDSGRPNDKKWHNKRSIISWIIWGGDSGRKFVNDNISLLNSHYNKKYTIV